MVRSSGNLIQWRKSLFDTFLVYNNKDKSMLRYKFGSVYIRTLVLLRYISRVFRERTETFLHVNMARFTI